MRQAAEGAAKLLAADDGPRIAALAFDGWDTHVNEGGATGRLAQLLGGLDGALAAFEGGLGQHLARHRRRGHDRVRQDGPDQRNGRHGPWDGYGGIPGGGAMRGGRVIADWPGLKTAQLYEARDLRPTTDLRSVLKGILQEQWGLSRRSLATEIFPIRILFRRCRTS